MTFPDDAGGTSGSGNHLFDDDHPYERLVILGRYDWESTALRADLDAVSTDTAQRLRVPVALVNVILDSAQLMAGNHGLTGLVKDAGGTPIEWSFCARVLTEEAPCVVPDARVHPVHHDNPLVTDGSIVAYAGVPLTTLDGHVIGAHCVIDTRPREFGDADLRVLRAAAREAAQAIERHRMTVSTGA